MAELSVLIVNYNTWRECVIALRTLRLHGPTRPDGSPMPYECIVVDNNSPHRPPEGIAAVEAELRQIVEQQGDPQAGRLILHGENGGYSKGMNLALQHSRGRWILVSNPDLVERFANGWELNPPADTKVWSAPDARGYTDFPFHPRS